MHPSDADLVRRVREGGADSVAVLVEPYYRPCLRFALRMLGDRADAEEATQDAFVRAYRSLDRYEDRNRFGAWLFQILVNQCRSVLRRQRTRERLFVPYDFAAELVGSEEPEDRHWSAAVQRALLQLAPPLREALLLRCVEEQSYEEIAKATGAGVSAVKMRVKRARDRMRELLQESHSVG